MDPSTFLEGRDSSDPFFKGKPKSKEGLRDLQVSPSGSAYGIDHSAPVAVFVASGQVHKNPPSGRGSSSWT